MIKVNLKEFKQALKEVEKNKMIQQLILLIVIYICLYILITLGVNIVSIIIKLFKFIW